jgi:hypothetical protein
MHVVDGKMLMPTNYKSQVRERMEKTGESWQTAARAVRERVPTPPDVANLADKSRESSLYARCFGEHRCPLAGWDGKGPRPECDCLGVDTSLPLLDGDD